MKTNREHFNNLKFIDVLFAFLRCVVARQIWCWVRAATATAHSASRAHCALHSSPANMCILCIQFMLGPSHSGIFVVFCAFCVSFRVVAVRGGSEREDNGQISEMKWDEQMYGLSHFIHLIVRYLFFPSFVLSFGCAQLRQISFAVCADDENARASPTARTQFGYMEKCIFFVFFSFFSHCSLRYMSGRIICKWGVHTRSFAHVHSLLLLLLSVRGGEWQMVLRILRGSCLWKQQQQPLHGSFASQMAYLVPETFVVVLK